MASETTKRGGVNALLFYAGLEITYNLGGAKLSSPQTTELRVAGEEGGGAAESTLMKWVHLATGQSLALTAIVGFVSGNWFSFLGALIGSADMQASYWYAKRCGRRQKNGVDTTAPGYVTTDPPLSDLGDTVWSRP